jgi:hypothetical protein
MNETSKTKPGWRIARRLLIALAVMATLIAIFYTEEDWRGKRAWEQCKRQLETQGVVLDWNKYLPPSLPDDQNFYTASSNILLRFKQIGEEDTNELEAAHKSQWLKLDPFQPNKNAGASDRVPSFPILDTSKTGPIVLAKIIISPKTAVIDSDSNTLVVAFNDPAAPKRARDLIQATMGRTIHGAQGFEFSEFQLANLQPAQIFLQMDTRPSDADLAAFIPSGTIGDKGRLRLVAMPDQYFFQVQLTRNIRITAAADYLAWSDQFVPAFDEIREALKRPYAILPGDYSIPYRMPIPNFVTMRALAQTLAQRAQCDLLLGKPDQALHELTLIHDVCRILEKPPTGQPETLVEAMINVAITGLYVAIIEEGMKRHEWQEPQLETFQEQLAQVNLPSPVKWAFAMEMAATPHTLETISSWKLKDWFSVYPGTTKRSVWQTIMNWRWSFVPLVESVLIPRGWIYQNMVTSATLMNKQTAGFDSTEGIIQPQKFLSISHELKAIPMRYKYFAAEMIPNLTKVWQTTAYNQTLVNEAQIACALERCRLVHDEYPDSLNTLMPGYIATIPQDLIDGQPLHYRRTDDGKFLLYSVGWNERDDGGKVALTGSGNVNYTTGDWAWLGGIK